MNFEIPNYTLQKKLGEGAMAEVWLAEHKSSIVPICATKTLHGDTFSGIVLAPR